MKTVEQTGISFIYCSAVATPSQPLAAYYETLREFEQEAFISEHSKVRSETSKLNLKKAVLLSKINDAEDIATAHLNDLYCMIGKHQQSNEYFGSLNSLISTEELSMRHSKISAFLNALVEFQSEQCRTSTIFKTRISGSMIMLRHQYPMHPGFQFFSFSVFQFFSFELI